VPTLSRDPCFPQLPGYAHRELPLDAASLTTAPRLAFAIRQDPPLARPRPRELAIRLEEDRAHASLGQAPPADFCNTRHDARTHPFERSILAREFGGRSPCFTRARALATNPRCPPAIPLSRSASRTLTRPLGWLMATSRASYGGFRLRGQHGPRAPERRAHRLRASFPPRTFPRAPGSPHRCLGRSWRLPSLQRHGLGPLPPPPREERRFPKDRGALRRFGTIEPYVALRPDDSTFLERAARLLPRATPRIGPVSRRPSRFRDCRGIAPEGRAFFSVAAGASP